MEMILIAIEWRFHDTGQKHHYSLYIQQQMTNCPTTDLLAGNNEFQPYDLK